MLPCTPAGRARRPAALLVPTAALLLVTAACTQPPASDSPAARPPSPATAPAPTLPGAQPDPAQPPLSVVAYAEVPMVEVFAAPGGGAQPTHRLANPRPLHDTQLLFLVREQRPGWLKVLVPVRPNGTEGWIRESDVRLGAHDFRIVVELGAHRITVYQGNDVFHEEPVGLGRGTTPTPGGLFYTVELLEVEPSQPQYGPYAYGLSGYSEVLYEFAGGDGQFGIHGTNDPSSLGSAVSAGCIRMSNEGITKLARTLPLGVPVEIRA